MWKDTDTENFYWLGKIDFEIGRMFLEVENT